MTTKSDISNAIKRKYPHLSLEDSKYVVDKFLKEISKALKSGERIELRGFGSFTTKTRPAGKARNPKTGENIMTNDKQIVNFRPSAALKNKLN